MFLLILRHSLKNNMALNEQEKQIAQYGAKQGKTSIEIQGAISKYRESQTKEPGLGSAISKRFETASGAVEKAQMGQQSPISAVLQTTGQIAGAGVDVIGAGIKAITSDFVERGIAKGVGAIVSAMPKEITDLGGEAVMAYKKLKGTNPELVANLEATGNILAILPVGKGVQVAGKGVVDTGARVVSNVGEIVAPIAKGTKDVAKMAIGGVSRVPSRIATNVAEKQAGFAEIKNLPTETARKTAQSGVETLDVKKLYSIPEKVRPRAKELSENIMKFAKGESDVDPIEIVGKPIVERVKNMEKLRMQVGKKLGDVAENLGDVKSTEMIPPIAQALQKVKGLEGIKISTNGKIDFTNTVLTTAETAADREAIQSIFTQAIKSGTGKQKHLLRQELFEVLGGKKRASLQLTDTQDKAYQAVRSGLSNVLETKNATYKNLSNQYRKVIEPLTEIRKKLRAMPGVTEDVLDMTAGILARRLTSTSVTQGELRTILNKLDAVTKIKGNTLEATEALQNVYNILGKYYDIAPKTGFQGQVKAGMEGTGLVDLATRALRGVAGETPAVRQKALEEAFKEIFK